MKEGTEGIGSGKMDASGVGGRGDLPVRRWIQPWREGGRGWEGGRSSG